MATYEQALLAKDVKTEELKEQRELERAERAREKGSMFQKVASTVGGVIGGVVGGPAGYVAGSTIGNLGADFLDKSEKKKVSKGKFNMSESNRLNKQLRDFDKMSNVGNVVKIGTDIISGFGMGGGFEAIRGGEGIGSALTNKDYWTKFGGDTLNLYDFFKKNPEKKIGDYFSYIMEPRKIEQFTRNNPIQMDAINVLGGS